MIKILFVCHGNICRSPMAEYVMRDLAEKAGAELVVASCAVSREEIGPRGGNPVYPPARRELERRGVPCGDHRAVQLEKADYDRYDLILCMDRSNCKRAVQLLGGDPAGKVRLLLGDREVADPWYSDRFDTAFEDIEQGCRAWLAALTEGEEG